MKAALVNTNTGIVELVIIVNSLDDIVPQNYKLVEIPMIENYGGIEEEKQLFDILKEIDPDYIDSKCYMTEKPVNPGITKWSEELGLYEE